MSSLQQKPCLKKHPTYTHQTNKPQTKKHNKKGVTFSKFVQIGFTHLPMYVRRKKIEYTEEEEHNAYDRTVISKRSTYEDKKNNIIVGIAVNYPEIWKKYVDKRNERGQKKYETRKRVLKEANTSPLWNPNAHITTRDDYHCYDISSDSDDDGENPAPDSTNEVEIFEMDQEFMEKTKDTTESTGETKHQRQY